MNKDSHQAHDESAADYDWLAVEGSVLRVRGLDAINGAPVLDLKPA